MDKKRTTYPRPRASVAPAERSRAAEPRSWSDLARRAWPVVVCVLLVASMLSLGLWASVEAHRQSSGNSTESA